VRPPLFLCTADILMTKLELLNKLKSLWYISGTEDENKKECVARYDVLSIIKSSVKDENLSLTDIWEIACDAAVAIDKHIYSENLIDATSEMNRLSTQSGQLRLSDFIRCFASQYGETTFDENLYVKTCHNLATALEIDICDTKINPEFWVTAYDDDLSPLEAVLNSQK
jgi:hypothetical protein